MTPNKLNYRLAVSGIFGRNRKPKMDLFLIAARVDVATRYNLREEPVEFDGTTELFALCSERVLLRGVVGGEEETCAPTS